MEKNMKKNVHICINESLCCTPETNNMVNQLYVSKINFKKTEKFFKVYIKSEMIPRKKQHGTQNFFFFFFFFAF